MREPNDQLDTPDLLHRGLGDLFNQALYLYLNPEARPSIDDPEAIRQLLDNRHIWLDIRFLYELEPDSSSNPVATVTAAATAFAARRLERLRDPVYDGENPYCDLHRHWPDFSREELIEWTIKAIHEPLIAMIADYQTPIDPRAKFRPTT